MKNRIFQTLAVLAFLMPCLAGAQKVDRSVRDHAISIDHGKVINVEQVELKSNAAKGAKIGGLVGVASQHGKSGKEAAEGALVGALLGALVGKAASRHHTAYAYQVQHLDGSETRIVTEQSGIRVGDCVAIESGGDHDNIRRVSEAVCAHDQPHYAESSTWEEHRQEAAQCDEAKHRLLDSNDDEEIKRLAYKVQVLCDS